MVFEYTPITDTLIESFWTFSIPSQGIGLPFMLVGNVAEPRVSLDRPAIAFGQVIMSWLRQWVPWHKEYERVSMGQKQGR